MRIYAQTPMRRTGQLIGDLFLLAWCALWITIAVFIHGLISALAGLGRTLEEAGTNLTGSMNEVSDNVGDVPVAGDALQAPFDLAGTVGDAIRDAGVSQQEVVATLAFWLALVIAFLPIAWAALNRLPARFRWIKEADAAAVMIEDVELFAMRALINRPLTELARVSPTPASDVRMGDATTIRDLARLELASLGLRPPSEPAAAAPATEPPAATSG